MRNAMSLVHTRKSRGDRGEVKAGQICVLHWIWNRQPWIRWFDGLRNVDLRIVNNAPDVDGVNVDPTHGPLPFASGYFRKEA